MASIADVKRFGRSLLCSLIHRSLIQPWRVLVSFRQALSAARSVAIMGLDCAIVRDALGFPVYFTRRTLPATRAQAGRWLSLNPAVSADHTAIPTGSPDTPLLARPTLHPTNRNIQTLGGGCNAMIQSGLAVQAVTVAWLDGQLPTAPNRNFMRFGDQNRWR